MCKVNIYSFRNDKFNTRAEERGLEYNIYRSDFTNNFIRSNSVENILGSVTELSTEALWVITGLIANGIKIEETVNWWECVKGNGNLIDWEMEGTDCTDRASEMCQN
jgi:hypothetical protein